MAVDGITKWTPSLKEIGRNPVSEHCRLSLSVENEWGLERDKTAKPVSRDQILTRERGQRKKRFPASAGRDRDRHDYPRLINTVLKAPTVHTHLLCSTC